jgi:ABC-type nitrate/sulfonate/bicarbonate transport system substrate-binding protein
VKDQRLLCGALDATTMSMGKYVTAKFVSHTETVPVDPLAVATGLTYRRGNGIFVRADSGIEDASDLRGRRVGIHDTTLAMTYHKALLAERFDVDPATVTWVVEDHHALGERMERGDLDGVERLNDWYWGWRTDEGYRLLYDMGQAWHDEFGYYPLVHLVAVDREQYGDDPDRIDALVGALRASREYRDEHRTEILRSFVESGVGEWEGERTVAALERATGGVECPFDLGASRRRNVRDWTAFAERFGVFESPPFDDDRLFPE